jgi:hypothetical protein
MRICQAVLDVAHADRNGEYTFIFSLFLIINRKGVYLLKDKIQGLDQTSGCPTQYVKFLEYEEANYDTIW